MVSRLTASLAHVSTREHLRVRISQNLLTKFEEAFRTFSAHALPPRGVILQACEAVCADNLELGSRLVENIAAERAVHEVDAMLSGFYNDMQSPPPRGSSERKDGQHGGSSSTVAPAMMRVYASFGQRDDETKRQKRSNPMQSPSNIAASPFHRKEHKLRHNQGLKYRVHRLLDDWLSICLLEAKSSTIVTEEMYRQFLHRFKDEGWVENAQSAQTFFFIATELCVESSCRSIDRKVGAHDEGKENSAGSKYTAVDALARLMVFLVKFLDCDDRVGLLATFLQSVVHQLLQDHDSKSKQQGSGVAYNQKPHLRLFVNVLHDLDAFNTAQLNSPSIDLLVPLAEAFHAVRPERAPAFAFAWMELVSHRLFMPKLLLGKPSRRGSSTFELLLLDLLAFLRPYLINQEKQHPIGVLYMGTLRLLLVLLHDFPEFLSQHHFSLCNTIPLTCVQMRNIILSAFPRMISLPDPLTPHLRVENLPDMRRPPHIACDMKEPLLRRGLLKPLKSYLGTRWPISFPKKLCEQIRGKLQPSSASSSSPSAALEDSKSTRIVGGVKRRAASTAVGEGRKERSVGVNSDGYDMALINSLVLCTGMHHIARMALEADDKSGGVIGPGDSSTSHALVRDNASMDVYEALMANLDAEGRHYVLNAIANQLRFPNNHTQYFSRVMLSLFANAKGVFVKEQVTRVLLERLIVHKPHPWGILVTAIELIRNPKYEFAQQPFTTCAPEIVELLDSLTRSCMMRPNAAVTEARATLSAGNNDDHRNDAVKVHNAQVVPGRNNTRQL
uniref:CCR4-Not complex component Not1 C-terminal domain-containing protein n=1 Tax=Lotharella globosa TaxID=91324 RepID=A0A7S3YYI4_9EUKA